LISKLRERTQGESGFTLVELLVVMLIIGLLAAIAIPAFFNQKSKADDTQSKVFARTAETAMETYNTDNSGSYANATAGTATSALNKIEPTLNGAGTGLTVDSASTNAYQISVLNPTTNDKFTIARNSSGVTSLTCTPVNTNGCPASGNWG
jgi:type IV pilus assembly protein PilA